MLNATWRILLVDNDEADYFLTRHRLAEARRDRFILEWAPTYAAGEKVLATDRFDAVLVNFDLDACTGIQLIREMVKRGYPSPMILITARHSYEVDVEAMQAGAADYLTISELSPALLERSIRYAIDQTRSEEALRITEESPNPVMRIYRDGLLMYANPASRPLLESIGCQMGQAVPVEWQEYVGDVLWSGRRQELEITSGGRTYSCTLSPVTRAGYVNIYCTDVTDRERLEILNDRQRADLEIRQRELEANRAALEAQKAALEGQNELLQQVIQNAPVNIFMLEGPEYRYMLYNPAHKQYARDRGELIGRRFAEVWPEAPRLIEYLDNIYRSGEPWVAIDAPVPVFEDGGERIYYFSITLTPLRNEQGSLDRILVMAADTTSQVTMRRQVEDEQARLSAIINNAPVGILVADNNMRIIVCNPAAEKFVGSRASIDGMFTGETPLTRCADGLPYEPGSLPLVRSIREAGTFSDVEMCLFDKSGQRRTLLVNSAPVYDTCGQVIGGVTVLRDVTDLKRTAARLEGELEEHKRTQAALMEFNEALAEANAALRKRSDELRQSEGRFRVALAGAPVSVFSMDRDLRFTWVYQSPNNSSAEQMVGRQVNQLPGAENMEELIAAKRQVLENERGVQKEVRVRINGEWRQYIVTAEPLFDEHGQVSGLTGATLEVTEQRRLEARQVEYAAQMEVQRRLLQHREMERAQIARDLHDGPIQNLISLVFTLQTAQSLTAEPASPETLVQVRQQVQALVTELRGVCNELRPPALARFGLEQAIRSHAEEFQNKHGQLKVSLDLMQDNQVSSEPDGPQNSRPPVLPDETRLALYRIYQECMNNTVRHACATEVAVRFATSAENVLLEVRDNGKGFDLPSDWVELARQGHLGLVGMRERAEAVGGTVRFESHPGAGTRIQVIVPCPE